MSITTCTSELIVINQAEWSLVRCELIKRIIWARWRHLGLEKGFPQLGWTLGTICLAWIFKWSQIDRFIEHLLTNQYKAKSLELEQLFAGLKRDNIYVKRTPEVFQSLYVPFDIESTKGTYPLSSPWASFCPCTVFFSGSLNMDHISLKTKQVGLRKRSTLSLRY